MNRLRPVLILLAASALALAVAPACTVVDPPALSVGSYTLSRKAFLDEMTELTNKGVLDGQSRSAPAAGGTTTVPTNFKTDNTATVLNVHAQYQIVTQELVRQNIQVTPEDQNAFLQATVQRAAQQGQQVTVEQLQGQLGQLDKLTKMNVDTQIAQQALARALVSPPEATDKAKADYEANKEKLAQTCLSLIHATAGEQPTQQNPSPPTPTEADYAAALAKVQAARAKIDGGASFAEVAKTDSDEPQTAAQGGALPQCLTTSQLQQLPAEAVDVVNKLAINAVSDPIRLTGDGYYLFSVTSRQTPSFADVQKDLEAQARSELATDRTKRAIQDAANRTTVTVDPLFGRWDTKAFQVVPPSSADLPATSTSTAPDLLSGLPSGGAAAGSRSPSASPSSTAARP